MITMEKSWKKHSCRSANVNEVAGQRSVASRKRSSSTGVCSSILQMQVIEVVYVIVIFGSEKL